MPLLSVFAYGLGYTLLLESLVFLNTQDFSSAMVCLVIASVMISSGYFFQ